MKVELITSDRRYCYNSLQGGKSLHVQIYNLLRMYSISEEVTLARNHQYLRFA